MVICLGHWNTLVAVANAEHAPEIIVNDRWTNILQDHSRLRVRRILPNTVESLSFYVIRSSHIWHPNVTYFGLLVQQEAVQSNQLKPLYYYLSLARTTPPHREDTPHMCYYSSVLWRPGPTRPNERHASVGYCDTSHNPLTTHTIYFVIARDEMLSSAVLSVLAVFS